MQELWINLLKNTTKVVLFQITMLFTFTSVFHRILDFKAGLDFYPGPFLFLSSSSPVLSMDACVSK
jgi:hypothetical protein